MSTHEFKVEMTCEGCSGTVTRVLAKLGDKIEKLDIDLPGKTVYVTSQLPSAELLDVIKKTGIDASYVGVRQ